MTWSSKISEKIGSKSLSRTEVDILESITVGHSSLTTTMKICQATSHNLHKILYHPLNINLLTPQIQFPFNKRRMNKT